MVGSMVAGAFAGTAEHIVMYPVDSVKVGTCLFLPAIWINIVRELVQLYSLHLILKTNICWILPLKKSLFLKISP